MLRSHRIRTTALLPFLALLTATGCNAPKDTSNTTEDNLNEEYIQAACQFAPTEGDHAQPGQAQPDVRKTYFDKAIDAAALKRVRSTSIVETVKVANSYGVEVHRINKSGVSCNPFDFLAEAPSDFEMVWNSATEGASSKGFLAGLYLNLNSPEAASTSRSAMIGVRRDGNRWIVVHEFMHHLFELEAAKAGMGANAVENNMNSASDAMDAAGETYSAKPTHQNLMSLMNAFETVDAALIRLTIQFPLEEVTVETMLQDGVKAGAFSYFPSRTHSSNSYIESSAQKARDYLEKLDSVTDHLRIEVMSDLSRSDDELARVNALSQAHADLNSQIRTVLKRTQPSVHVNLALTENSVEPSAKTAPQTSGVDATGDSTPSCSHTHDADAATARATNSLNRLGAILSTASRR